MPQLPFLIGVLIIFRTNYIFLAQKKLTRFFLEKVGPLGGGSWPPGSEFSSKPYKTRKKTQGISQVNKGNMYIFHY